MAVEFFDRHFLLCLAVSRVNHGGEPQPFSVEQVMSLSFEILIDPDWSELDKLSDRTIFQTKSWLDFVSEAQGATPLILKVREGSQTAGYFTGLVFKKFGMKILGSPFPGWTTSYQGFNLHIPHARVEALAGLFRFAFKELGVSHVELMDRRLTVDEAKALGWKHRVFSNFEIDLSPSDESIFAQMKGSCRTSIRKSEKDGIAIESSTDLQFAEDYYAQLVEVFGKQGLKPTYGLERVQLLMKHLLPTGSLLLLRARTKNGDCAATGIYPAYNGTMYFWGGASWRKFQIHQPNEPLHWFAMKYWKSRGMTRCDMGGGGEYKRKYGGREIAVPWIRASRYPGLEFARNFAKKLQSLRQKVRHSD